MTPDPVITQAIKWSVLLPKHYQYKWTSRGPKSRLQRGAAWPDLCGLTGLHSPLSPVSTSFAYSKQLTSGKFLLTVKKPTPRLVYYVGSLLQPTAGNVYAACHISFTLYCIPTPSRFSVPCQSKTAGYGIKSGRPTPCVAKVSERSRSVASTMHTHSRPMCRCWECNTTGCWSWW